MFARYAAALVLLFGLGGSAAAGKAVVAVRAAGAIAIDGRLDEPTWTTATFLSDFAQKEPTQDAPPTDRTEVAIAYDDHALYVAARMALSDPAALDRPMTRRDDTSGAERFIVSFDPHRSRRTAYSFAVTAAGVRADWIHTDDSEYERDHSWNPVWSAAARVDGAGWIAELRIPFSQLRFPADPTPVWGINFNRYVPRSGEDDFWIVVPKDRTGWSSYFGELRGLAALEPRLRLEVLPYLAGDLRLGSGGTGAGGNAGVDLKLGLGPSLTLDATVNPDFGQIEADPAVVNLGAYEVIFPERRPFFVEGAQIFTSQPRTYFYSRRIGADDARILGATKLTGQLLPRTNLGALAAVTAPVDAEAGPVAPLAGWGVLRVERELDADASLLGLTFTGVSRDVDDPVIAAALPRAAIAGGGDLKIRLDGGRYELFAAAGASAVAGTPAAITAIQTAPAHYFQRPDAEHLGVDPDTTLLTGWHADLRGARRAGDWRFEAIAGAESPGLELDDVGTLQSADDLEARLWVARVETEPGRHLHGWQLSLSDAEEWSFDGTHKPAFTELAFEATLPGFTRVFGNLGVARPGLLDDKTRGGPLMGVGWGGWSSVSVNSNGAGPVVWGANAGIDGSRSEGRSLAAGASALWHVPRVGGRLHLQLAPRLRLVDALSQYVDAIAGTAGGADTYGTRYLFADLGFREVAVQLRAQLALTPELTIDGYVEPFASSGRYDRFGELPAPRRDDLRRYADVTRAGGQVTVDDGGDVFAFDDPDFTYLSLRSTVVLRWELRAGSVLYAVWQQDRSREDAIARRLGGAAGDVFTAPGAHVLAAKLSYWWSP